MNALRTFVVLVNLSVLAALAGCTSVGIRTATNGDEALAIDREALMIVIKDPRSERRRRGLGAPGYATAAAYVDDPALSRASNRLAEKYALNVLTHWPLRNLPVHCIVVESPDASTLSALQTDPAIEWVQPFNAFTTQTAAGAAPPELKNLLRATPEQGAGVTIAVIDTSVDSEHPALSGSYVRQHNFAGAAGNLGNERHGTAVVGLIAARADSGNDMRGIAQAADVEVLRACWQAEDAFRGRCNTLTIALALDAAIDLQPDIVNLSLTGPADRILDQLIDTLVQRDTLVIAAFDEALDAGERFPQHRPGVVYAYGSSGAAQLPNSGGAVLLSAPRHAVSLAPASGYDLVSGHSVAAPQVSAVAARLIGQRPGASRDEILQELSVWLAQN